MFSVNTARPLVTLGQWPPLAWQSFGMFPLDPRCAGPGVKRPATLQLCDLGHVNRQSVFSGNHEPGPSRSGWQEEKMIATRRSVATGQPLGPCEGTVTRMVSETIMPETIAWAPESVPTGQPQADYLTSLSLSFVICKVGVRAVSASLGGLQVIHRVE